MDKGILVNIGTPTVVNHTTLDETKFEITNNAPSDNIYEVGETTVTWTITDSCGFSLTCDQIIKVSFQPCPDAVDYEDTVYHSVRLGSGCKCWTTTNLKSTKYSDGRQIEDVMDYYSYDYTGQLCNSQPEEMVSNTFSINWNGVNENNYDVTINYGTLALLTNGLLFVKAVGVEKTYDAVPVNVNQNINESYNIIAYYIRENVTPGVNDTIYYTMGSGNTIVGASGIEYTVNVVMNNGTNFTVLNADTVENAVTSVTVTTNSGDDIISSFTKVVKDTALIQINPIEITLTSYDGEWTYDGEPHSRTGVSVEGSFLTGDLQDAPAANTEVTTYGTYTNTITYTLASGVNPVNYKVTKNEGSLVINKRPLYLRGVDKLVDYQSGVTQIMSVERV